MLDHLIAIPGPLFLLLFWVLAVLGIWHARSRVNAEQGHPDGQLPDPAQLDPRTLAALRGGTNAVLRLTAFKLLKQESLELQEDGKTPRLASKVGPGSHTGVEGILLQACATPRTPAWLFRELHASVERALWSDYLHLVRLGLMHDSGARARAWGICLYTLLAVNLAGGAKLALGILRNRPVGFLALSMILFTVILLAAVRPWRAHRLTRAGTRLLAESRERLAWTLDPRSQGADPLPALLLGMAIFGTASLAQDPAGVAFNRSFAASGTGGCSGGCGTSSGSDSGGDGGDGGGDGGGGCGGCGGD